MEAAVLEQSNRAIGVLLAADAAVREDRVGVAWAMLEHLPFPSWFGGGKRRKMAASAAHVAMLRGTRTGTA